MKEAEPDAGAGISREARPPEGLEDAVRFPLPDADTGGDDFPNRGLRVGTGSDTADTSREEYLTALITRLLST